MSEIPFFSCQGIPFFTTDPQSQWKSHFLITMNWRERRMKSWFDLQHFFSTRRDLLMPVNVCWCLLIIHVCFGCWWRKVPFSSSLPVSASGSASFPVSLHHVLHALLIRVWVSVRSGKFLGRHSWQSLLTMMTKLRQPSYHLILEWRSLVIWTKRVTLLMSHVAFLILIPFPFLSLLSRLKSIIMYSKDVWTTSIPNEG